MHLTIDFETRSTLELPEVGVHKYATHPSTDVWCMAWAFDDDEPRVWAPASGLPLGLAARVADYVHGGGLVAAHNAAFELQIWNHILVPRYGWPVLKPSQVRCTMAQAYSMALPGSLEKAAAAVGITQQKDLKGGRLMLQMSRPKGFDVLGDPIWWDDDDKRQQLYEYCKQDVRVEQALGARLLPLSQEEQALWELDYAINERGLYLDQPAIVSAMAIIEREQRRLEGEIRRRTESAVGSPAEVAALTRWVRDQGVELDGLAKSDVVELLHRDELPAHVRAVLRIRQEYAKTSTAKLNRMRDAASADGRIRFTMQYHGAGTGRWAGRRIQPQNLPRSTVSHEAIEEMLEYIPTTTPERAIEWLDLYYGEPMSMISNCLRGLICAAPGKTLVAGDFSNIEGRVLAWLAGEEWKLNAFRAFDAGTGPDIYKLSYSKSFGVPVSDITKDQRQIGKVMELACIAEGSRVLTDAGLVAIERVTPAMRVWDGVDFVEHDGVVYQGIKEVLRYDGLTATADHLVWIEGASGPVSFGHAAASGARLLQSGAGRAPLRVGGDHQTGQTLSEGMGDGVRGHSMCGLRVRTVGLSLQSITGNQQRMPVVFAADDCTKMAYQARRGDAGAMHQPPRRWMDTLRRAGDTVSIQDGVDRRTMDRGSLRTRPDPRHRPHRQQRALRTGESPLCHTGGEQPQSAPITGDDGQRRVGAVQSLCVHHDLPVLTQGIPKGSDHWTGVQSGAREAEELADYPRQLGSARVYDIVNAGPRRRFTVENALVHNCGYQGGVGAFQTMARGYGVKVTDERANEIKTLWRDSHPRVVSYWWDLERAALEAVAHPGAKVSVRQTTFVKRGSFLFAKLPSGRMLTYPYPTLKAIETPWGEMKEQVHYMKVNGLSNKWEESHAYGGLWAENITQAVARDILAEAITRVSRLGYDVVLSVHDEIVAEMPEQADWLENLLTQMKVLPAWAAGLPVAAEGFTSKRYRK